VAAQNWHPTPGGTHSPMPMSDASIFLSSCGPAGGRLIFFGFVWDTLGAGFRILVTEFTTDQKSIITTVIAMTCHEVKTSFKTSNSSLENISYIFIDKIYVPQKKICLTQFGTAAGC
jgi:hypothetical protein